MSQITPRAAAAAAIEAVLAGRDPTPELQRLLDPAHQALARAQAAAAMVRLRGHARIAATTPGYLRRLPATLARQITRYLETHHG